MARTETGPHIHTPDDGRGTDRVVYVDGKEVHSVFYVDTQQGFVDYYPGFMLDRNDEIITHRLYGEVRVEGALW